jgi:hypothetical protein
MTEQEWLSSAEPLHLLKWVFAARRRKSRLFAVACCRRIWHLLVDERSQRAVEVAERYADGAATDQELSAAAHAADQAHREMFETVGKAGSCLEWAAEYAAHPNPLHAAKNVSWMAATPRSQEVRRPRSNDWDEIRLYPCAVTRRTKPLSLLLAKWNVSHLDAALPTGAEKAVQTALVRDIFGNPFRSMTIDSILLEWGNFTIPKLAQAIYDHRRYSHLPILADALEDAGCTNEDLLSHCRQPGEHVRGCFAVDLILRKE